ncbi:MAG: hypothetical protein KJ697_04085 [Nanoarchaeota archaeon]|nr:hypothetical protein [Nanoarchaeota archaeon]
MTKTKNISKNKWIRADVHIITPSSKLNEVDENLNCYENELGWSYKIKGYSKNQEIVISPKNDLISPEELAKKNEILFNIILALIKEFEHDRILFACFRIQYDIRKWRKMKKINPAIERKAFSENLINMLKDRYEDTDIETYVCHVSKYNKPSEMEMISHHLFHFKHLLIFTQIGVPKDSNTQTIIINLISNNNKV